MNHLMFLLSTHIDINAGVPFFQSLQIMVPSCPIQVNPPQVGCWFLSLSYSWDFTLLVFSSCCKILKLSSFCFWLFPFSIWIIFFILTKINNKNHLTLETCLWLRSSCWFCQLLHQEACLLLQCLFPHFW